MGKKTSVRQILVSLERVVGMDMHNFLYMLQTGRYINDPRIVIAMNCGTIGEAVRAVADHGRFDYKTYLKGSVKELTKKGYITTTAIKQAKQIKRYAETKTLLRGR